MKAAIVTGSGGLIGSAASKFLLDKGYIVYGIDNDMRKYFFGDEASTKLSQTKLSENENFISLNIDIRDFADVTSVFKQAVGVDIVVHTAAQPSHDWAAKEPLTDFTVNALGTMNLLEATRLNAPKATFIFTSTNKVYGDRPNYSYEQRAPDMDYNLEIKELETRYEGFGKTGRWAGLPISIDESMTIDNSKHSIFGASKVAADIMVQEYGKYFGMNTVVFRGGCLTGPDHSGAELHGFLSYLIKCMVHRKDYTIFGYKGKQVRDNIYSEDLIEMFWEYHLNPRPGEVYNAGGGRENSISMLEAITRVNEILVSNGKEPWNKYTLSDKAREGDHIWYISDLHKFKNHYPNWKINTSIDEILTKITLKELGI
jgi:CDP-paratose 2-epimerase